MLVVWRSGAKDNCAIPHIAIITLRTTYLAMFKPYLSSFYVRSLQWSSLRLVLTVIIYENEVHMENAVIARRVYQIFGTARFGVTS